MLKDGKILKQKMAKQREGQKGVYALAAREIFRDLATAKSGSSEMRKSVKFVKRCHEKFISGEFDAVSSSLTKFRRGTAGRPKSIPELRVALFNWVVDVRDTLKGRLPLQLLRQKCDQLYDNYKAKCHEVEIQPEQLTFSNRWVSDFCKEYRLSLKKPNKRFKLDYVTRKRRIVQFIQNILRIRVFFMKTYKTDIVIWSSDQMPLHRNASASSPTLAFSGLDTFVKENYMLSRERATVLTSVTSNNRHPPPKPEFLFKGTGKRVNLSLPEELKSVRVQWAPKGSYRLENMIQFAKSLKQVPPLFPNQFKLITLDDYSVHLDDSLRKILLDRGYILVVTGGGITGDIQVNDTALHGSLKKAYRNAESSLELKQLEAHPDKLPSPSRAQMIDMLCKSFDTVQFDSELAFKRNFLSNKLDGSEDHLVSSELYNLVKAEVVEFRKNLMESSPPKSLSALLKTITPPEGVRTRQITGTCDQPEDEGFELLDGEYNSDEDIDTLTIEDELGKITQSAPEPVVEDELPVGDAVIAGEEITDLQSLSRIENTVKQEISTASNELRPFFNKLISEINQQRRKFRKPAGK